MSNKCINLDIPDPMVCIKQPVKTHLYKCWLIDDTFMFFNQEGVSRDDMFCILGPRPSYKPSHLINHLKLYGLHESTCLHLHLVDSIVDLGRLYTHMYEEYLKKVLNVIKQHNLDRGLDDVVNVRYKYRYGGTMMCGCGSNYRPPIVIPPPPFPIELKSQCLCVEYKGRTFHYSSNLPVSNIQIENILRNKEIRSIHELMVSMYPLLIEYGDIGVINGVLE